jgi:hypothetical protein
LGIIRFVKRRPKLVRDKKTGLIITQSKVIVSSDDVKRAMEGESGCGPKAVTKCRPKLVRGRELAEVLARTKLSAEEAIAWRRDLQAGRKILTNPLDKATEK